jgi:hypothetical protein
MIWYLSFWHHILSRFDNHSKKLIDEYYFFRLNCKQVNALGGDMRFLLKSFCSLILIQVLIVAKAYGSDLDPTSPVFDPKKQFSITPFGAIMGDPAQIRVISNNKTAFSLVVVTPTPNGLTAMLSVIEPQQNGEPGGGYALMMTFDEVELLTQFLHQAPEVDVSALPNYGAHHKLVGQVTAPNAPLGEIAVIYQADDVKKELIRIVQIVGGTPSIFELTQNAAQKLVQQIGHFVDQAELKSEATKL